jgi:hypothetical protein
MTGTTRDFRLIEEVGISNAAIVAVAGRAQQLAQVSILH